MSVKLSLESGLDLREVLSKGSVLHINEDVDDDHYDFDKPKSRTADLLGEPVMCLYTLKRDMTDVDTDGLVKKKILVEGGGFPIEKSNTVYVAFSGYWENELEPFDEKKEDDPLAVDLNDNGLLPGLQMAIESMLVGETSVFFLSYEVMYGELGIPPRIKPKSDCVFYIKLLRSIITNERKINFSEPNIFQRVLREVKILYGTGVSLVKFQRYYPAITAFRKAIYMLHRSRLADEAEELEQEKMLKKLYLNLAICSNFVKQPLKACIACNELHRLRSLWNNPKALFQNAKALRMIGQFDAAEKRLLRAKNLSPNKKEIDAEFELLKKMQSSCDQAKLLMGRTTAPIEMISEDFKREVDSLIKNFKENEELCKLVLPGDLNSTETEYIREACKRENVFFNKVYKDFALDKDEEKSNDCVDDNTAAMDNYDICGEQIS